MLILPIRTSNSSTPSARAAASCPILNLVLGPINLDLLGLEVHLGGGSSPTSNLPINLNITAVSGSGNLLGNLLCDVSNLLNPSGGSTLSGLTGSVQQLKVRKDQHTNHDSHVSK